MAVNVIENETELGPMDIGHPTTRATIAAAASQSKMSMTPPTRHRKTAPTRN